MRKKIIHIALGKANPERSNGVNKVVNSILTYQVSNGFDAEFWGITFNPVHNYPKRNYKTRVFNDYKLKFKIDPELKKAIQQLDPGKVIFHLHGAFIPQFYMVMRQLRKCQIPYFFTPHGGYNFVALQRSALRKKSYIRLFERGLVNNAKGVQLLGQSEKDGTQFYFNAPLHFIPNGQQPVSVRQQGSLGKAVKVGFLGRIDIHTKGLDMLLKGISKASKFIDIQLEIIGDGGEISKLKKMVAEHKLNNQVKFKGALYGQEKFDTIANWDALCLMSRNEGLPGVVLEAASIGVPSIVTKETNMGEYIQNYKSGWVLKKNVSNDLCETLRKLNLFKKVGATDSFGKAALKMIREEFDWNIVVKRLATAYEKD